MLSTQAILLEGHAAASLERKDCEGRYVFELFDGYEHTTARYAAPTADERDAWVAAIGETLRFHHASVGLEPMLIEKLCRGR